MSDCAVGRGVWLVRGHGREIRGEERNMYSIEIFYNILPTLRAVRVAQSSRGKFQIRATIRLIESQMVV